jgi:hypothetical protein
MDQGAVHFLEMTDLALGRGTNMDEQDRQDGARHLAAEQKTASTAYPSLLAR